MMTNNQTADCVTAINALENFSAQRDDDGIVTVTIDQSKRKMNVIGDGFTEAFATIVDSFINDDAAKGLILTSAKETFVVGADIDQLNQIKTAEQAFALTEELKGSLRKLEMSGKPVVAAMTGTALGGGLELALACHCRIAIDMPKTKLGLPEVKLGLLPGGGGTQRLPRLVGIQAALELMTQGKELRPSAAKDIGLIDATATDKADMLVQAKDWIRNNPSAQQPWDKKGFKIPGGDSKHPKIVPIFSIAPAMANQKSHGNYPAITHIMSCVFEGCLVDIDTGLEIESRYFAACVMSTESKNMINTLWTQLNSIKKGQSRPQGFEQTQTRKVGILGAGMMGAGIAYVTAKAGIDVVLLDTDIVNAEKGKAYSANILDKAISGKRATEEKKQALLERITPTVSYDDLADSALIIEAVFENREIKAKCTQQSEAVISNTAIYASNTSTLPITGLAKVSTRPNQFIGLHFFSPVDKMPLVEIIMGEQTDDATLAKAFDYVVQIGKTPIVVNDSHGFYTSRVFGTYVSEGIAMLGEGVHPRSIEVAGLKTGMPMPPLALQDEVSLSLALHVSEQQQVDMAAEGKSVAVRPSYEILKTLVNDHGREGKKNGKGFYDYPEDGDKHLWPELINLYPPKSEQTSQQDLVDRLMFIQANESAKCYEENVVRSVADTNIGSIFGWGFAPQHGGTLQFINAMGVNEFIKRSRELAAKYGERFEPAQILLDMAAKDEAFSDD
ncbi:3-hydroxyacyl-CoA dehydrogenase NAD-binding domain-containing protein [Psychrobacter sp. JB385]|uniref:3-hydroxyacyl-CoA dehydrogenase NAD-binding domain-containing protein n=1 Tax=Psychrobacter sp. JB385 TaxID=1434841 RepID=UPI00097F5081|nr:3-hydroxyacyl-CoA dehydrogenase NAD-binding domain-containing protein [Psychrobacter sp. JB385]SJN19632.1 Enoyl-CoA hydratase [isoleucine degradation] / 3-hydroxyacyl-CoA dehydrogenase / 3-hydroxybutyryl-CoA epimerase [Psychrobacter sp. JB385]